MDVQIQALITPAMILAVALWIAREFRAAVRENQREHQEIVREIRSLGERLSHLEGRIIGWQDRAPRSPQAAPGR